MILNRAIYSDNDNFMISKGSLTTNNIREFLLLIYVAVFPYENWGTFLAFGIGSPLKIVGLLYILSVIPLFIKGGTRPVTKEYVSVILLVIWLWVRNVFDLQAAKPSLAPFTNNILFALLLTYHLSISDKKLIIKLLFVMAVSNVIVSSLIAFDLISGLEVFEDRLIFMGMNSNDFSYLISVSILILLHIFRIDYFGWKKKRYLLLLGIPFLLYSLGYTGSRGGVITLGIGITAYFLLLGKSRSARFMSLLAGLLVIIILYKYLFSVEVIEGRFSKYNEDIQTFGNRIPIWKVAIGLFQDNPLFGVDFSTYNSAMMSSFGRYRSAHNGFIYLLALGGFFALVLFLKFIYNAFESCKHLIFKAFYLSLFLMQISFLLKSGAFFGYKLMWFLFALIFAAGFTNDDGQHDIRQELGPSQIDSR